MNLLYNKRISAVTLLISVVLLMSSCGSKKTVTTGGILKSKTQTEIVDDALSAQLQYKTISTKGSIEIPMGKSSAVYKIIKDSVLQASIRPVLGLEVFRITFTPNSVVIMDRRKKRYTEENIKDSELMKNFDFNFYNLQALLTNQLFIPGKKEVTPSGYQNFNITTTKDAYILETKDKGNLMYNFSVDASDRIVSTLIYSQKKDATIQWSYSDFIKDNNRMYPTTMKAKINVGKKQIGFTITYNSLDIDKDMDIDLSIPSKYEKVSFTELMGSYLKLK